MSTPDPRIALVYAGLTVSERMQVVLRNFKDGKPQVRDLIRMAPSGQTNQSIG